MRTSKHCVTTTLSPHGQRHGAERARAGRLYQYYIRDDQYQRGEEGV